MNCVLLLVLILQMRFKFTKQKLNEQGRSIYNQGTCATVGSGTDEANLSFNDKPVLRFAKSLLFMFKFRLTGDVF